MLSFSYQFFFFSFSSKFLLKYSNLFGFHILSKYCSLVFDCLYRDLYYFLFCRRFFLLHFLYILKNISFFKIKILFICSYFVNELRKINFNKHLYMDIKRFFNLKNYTFVIKFIFSLHNYVLYLYNYYFHVRLLKLIQQYKGKFMVWNRSICFLPSMSKIFTLLKSPHVHKKARDQYFFSMRKISFILKNFLTFYPKMFYLNFLNNIAIKLKRSLHFF